MKPILIFLLTFPAFSRSFSQDKTEKKLTYTISLDSAITPDFFNIEIAVAEYVKYDVARKKIKAVVVPLDTVSHYLVKDLARLGFKQSLKKSSIAEKNSRTNAERIYLGERLLFQVAYQFNVSNRDSVDYLFKGINKENLKSLIVTPKVSDTTLEKVREKLLAKGLNSIQAYAQKAANENGFKIIKQSNSHLGFQPKANNFTGRYNAYGGQKEFVIELGDVEYVLHAMYTYVYEDK